MHSNVIKQPSTPDEKKPVPFTNWVAAHADRIPGGAVTIDREELEQHSRPGYSHHSVISRNKTRVAAGHVAVDMLPGASLNLDRTSKGSNASGTGNNEDTPPFNLTEEEYEELREQWQEEQRERMQEERAQIRADAREEGYEEAAAEAAREIDELHTLLTDGLEQIHTHWAAQLEELEPHLGQLALDIAERILDAPLPEEIHEGVTAAIHDAIDEIAGETRTDVTLHPADFMRLRETGLLEQLNETYEALHWHSDPELEQRGDWIVETPRAAIRHIKKELLADVERTLELP